MSGHEGGREEEETTENGPQGGAGLDIAESFIAILTHLELPLSLG